MPSSSFEDEAGRPLVGIGDNPTTLISSSPPRALDDAAAAAAAAAVAVPPLSERRRERLASRRAIASLLMSVELWGVLGVWAIVIVVFSSFPTSLALLEGVLDRASLI